MLEHVDGLLQIALFLVSLLFAQRLLHREIQAILLLLTKRSDIAITIFAILLFPGVMLHESSHWIMARLLGVKTGRFSIIPKPLDKGRVRLGYVETSKADIVRDALIGLAPLLAGGAFIVYAGITHLDLVSFWEDWKSHGFSIHMISNFFNQPDFWIWFYLLLTVSSTMLPSASDRRAWVPVGIFLCILIATSLAVGAGPWLFNHLAGPVNSALKSIAVVFGISLIVHLVMFFPLLGLRRLLSYVLKLEVV